MDRIRVEVRVKVVVRVKVRVRVVCKIPFLTRTLGKKAAARPSARTTIGYLVYKVGVRDKVGIRVTVGARVKARDFGGSGKGMSVPCSTKLVMTFVNYTDHTLLF